MNICFLCNEKSKKKICNRCKKIYNINSYTTNVVEFHSYKQPSLSQYSECFIKTFIENKNSVVLLFYSLNMAFVLPYPVWIRFEYINKVVTQEDFKQKLFYRYKKEGAIFLLFEEIIGKDFYSQNSIKNFHIWTKVFTLEKVSNPLSEVLCYIE
jgi:hypothetical protein|uniref:Uncharacterized protein n=1 Tax=viral metagenome TaxID=1070528 RepID=A0A6C0J1P1_9ZZZZ